MSGRSAFGSRIWSRTSSPITALEVAHHLRVGVGPGGGADDVEGVVDVGDPVAQRLVHGILEGAAAGRDGP